MSVCWLVWSVGQSITISYYYYYQYHYQYYNYHYLKFTLREGRAEAELSASKAGTTGGS